VSMTEFSPLGDQLNVNTFRTNGLMSYSEQQYSRFLNNYKMSFSWSVTLLAFVITYHFQGTHLHNPPKHSFFAKNHNQKHHRLHTLFGWV